MAIIALVALAQGLQGQESAYRAAPQRLAVLPAQAESMFVVDDGLYCYSTGSLLRAMRRDGEVYCFVPDTLLASIDEGVEYAVRRPGDDGIYYTVRDRHGASRLFHAALKGGKYKAKRLKMDGMDVEHPCFSSDGRIMIFASRESGGSYGCSDLWYSVYGDGEWGKPENMGPSVNTRFDETAPFVYGDFLVFASNGREQTQTYYHLYGTRLLGDGMSGDTAGLLMVGTNQVQWLPEPINDWHSSNRELVFDTAAGRGYWLSSRDGGSVCSFGGELEGVQLWGRVADKEGKPLPGVTVQVRHDGKTVCSARSDKSGLYSVYLRRDQLYSLSFAHEGCFTVNKNMNTVFPDRDNLFVEHRLDVAMDSQPVGQPIRYDDLFGVGTGIELSAKGRELLAPLVQFLRDNPVYTVSFSLACDLSDDRRFNELLTAHRLVALKEYMDSELPETVKKKYQNSCTDPMKTGLSRLVVVIGR